MGSRYVFQPDFPFRGGEDRSVVPDHRLLQAKHDGAGSQGKGPFHQLIDPRIKIVFS